MGAAFSLHMRQTTSADPTQALSPATLRQNIEASIERLLVMLDTLDGDPDLEPSLGWSTELAAPSYCTIGPLAVDLEDDNEDEPSLGSLSNEMDQRRWNDGTRLELEEEDDDEPDLGFLVMSSCNGAFPPDERRKGPHRYRDEFDFVGQAIDTRAPEDRT